MTKLNTRQLLGLALPSAASVVLTNAYRSVDQYWLQWVSTDAQAAVGSLAFVLIAGFAFFEVTAVGAAPLIARATGAENPEERRKVLGTALSLSVMTGFALGAVGYLFASAVPGMLGLSGGAGTLLFASVYWVLLVTSVSPLGPHVNAALGIGFSALEGLTWPIFHGVSIAVGSVVGRALGAGKPEIADDCIRLATPLILTGGVVASLVFFFGARTLTGFFTEDPAVHEAATTYALVLAASQVFIALEALAEGVLVGAGDTKTVLAISLPLNVLRIPLAYLLAFPLGWGAVGIWWAINITSIAKALGKLHFMRRGGWKRLVI